MSRGRLACFLIATLALGACQSDENCHFLRAGPSTICGEREVEVDRLGGFSLPVIRATANGRAINLLIDTGADQTVISSKLLHVEDRKAHSLSSVCIDGTCLRQVVVYAWETPLSRIGAGEINGFLGIDVLRHFVFEMHRDGRIRLSYRGRPCVGTVVGYEVDSYSRPFASVAIDAATLGAVLLDTGASESLLTEASLSFLESYVVDRAAETGGCSVDGCVDEGYFLSEVQRYCVGPHCAGGIAVKFPLWNAVGNSFFENFDLAFDFINQTLVFCETRDGQN